ncbi:MAG TPA: hypothetical protein VEK79_15305 [Thermoanaerobaculia bacterium]|nr:hypothetical protein [Thermoanaerobaculia bacterium]
MIEAADIVLYDEFGQILLLAEVKTPPTPTSPEWAAEIRSHTANQLKGFVPRYFLVAARDYSYFWSSATPDVAPNARIRTEELLGPYLRDADLTIETIASSALDLVVGIWLRDLTHGNPRATELLPQELGLPAAASNGRIEFAAAA